MQPLSQALNNISSSVTPDNSEQSTSSVGSMQKAGSMTTPPALAPREMGLTQSQLTQIASNTLLEVPSISFAPDSGTSNEKTPEIFLKINKSAKITWFESALRQSQQESLVKHLTHLAVHRTVIGGAEGRMILISDYVQALKHYPEFVVYLACRCWWESATGEFFPKIDMLRSVCESIYGQLSHVLLPPPEKPKLPPRVRHDASDTGQSERNAICAALVALGCEDMYSGRVSNYQLQMLLSAKRSATVGPSKDYDVLTNEVNF